MNVRTEKSSGKKAVFIVLGCVLVAALAVAAYFLINILIENDRIMKNEKILQGVSVNGIDISEMTGEEALAATAKIQEDVLTKTELSIDVEGQVLKFTAKELGFTTDYEDVINQAVLYGHTDSLDERKQAIETAQTKGMKFTIKVKAVKENAAAVLLPKKAELDIAPAEPSFVFTPWGYLEGTEGTPYEENQQKMIEASAGGKMWERPALARIPEAEKPIKLRYLFWENSKYKPDYIPADADIRRFYYKEGVKGRSVNMQAAVDTLVSNVEKGDFSTVKAPVDPIEPTTKIEDIKAKTQLVASWTSSFSGKSHYGYNRNWNVAKLSGIINGQIIEPGKEWSINKTAGNRTVGGGWKKAAGIENGGFSMQAGGGVCQISSTLYNAAIRTALGTETAHHSISSDYIPLGLDATISSGSPDLTITNPYDTPVYIISFVNPTDKNVTVEIYGQPVTDPQYRPVILHFTSVSKGTYGTPKMKDIWNTAVCPEDGTVIPAGGSYVYAKARPGKRAQTYKIIYSLDGKELSKSEYKPYDSGVNNGRTYHNAQDPATLPPTPPPSPAPSTEPPPATS